MKEVPFIKFLNADVDSCLKMMFNNESRKDLFFSHFDNLWDILGGWGESV